MAPQWGDVWKERPIMFNRSPHWRRSENTSNGGCSPPERVSATAAGDGPADMNAARQPTYESDVERPERGALNIHTSYLTDISSR